VLCPVSSVHDVLANFELTSGAEGRVRTKKRRKAVTKTKIIMRRIDMSSGVTVTNYRSTLIIKDRV
jgi:hypothetical protein